MPLTYNAAAVSNTVIAHKKAPTVQAVRALRDNPLAAMEGAAGAPVVRQGWHPVDMVEYGDAATGTIYAATTVASVESPDFEDGYSYAFLFQRLLIGDTGNFRIELFRETAAAYASPQRLGNADATTPNTAFSGWLEIQRPRDVSAVHLLLSQAGYSNLTLTDASGIMGATGAYITHATAQKLLRARFSQLAGDLTAGTIRMFRRIDP